MIRINIVKIILITLAALPVEKLLAFENIDTLNQLMKVVEQSGKQDREINKNREKYFLQKKNEQERILIIAKNKLLTVKNKNKALKKDFDIGEEKLTKLENLLHQRAGSLGELFGVVRQVAGETSALLEHSIISSQVSNRLNNIREIADSKSLPSIYQLELLWVAMQREMIESGKVTRFQTNVVNNNGVGEDSLVTRVGAFNASSDGQFLRYNSKKQTLYQLVDQPSNEYLEMAASFEKSREGFVPMVIDPSRGVILDLYGLTPSILERISQGKLVGYVIIVLGVIGGLLLSERFFVLYKIEKNLNKQLISDVTDSSNALGRILAIYKSNITIDLSTLERKIDEAIIKEAPIIERGLSTIKILAVIAPLLGLLGTVTGMIETFQSITLFGTGDAKLMAGGISQALITTVLGLVVAIPLIFLHSIAANKSRRCINILEGQSAGLIALHAENEADR